MSFRTIQKLTENNSNRNDLRSIYITRIDITLFLTNRCSSCSNFSRQENLKNIRQEPVPRSFSLQAISLTMARLVNKKIVTVLCMHSCIRLSLSTKINLDSSAQHYFFYPVSILFCFINAKILTK